jgi:murein endopeptidase
MIKVLTRRKSIQEPRRIEKLSNPEIRKRLGSTGAVEDDRQLLGGLRPCRRLANTLHFRETQTGTRVCSALGRAFSTSKDS